MVADQGQGTGDRVLPRARTVDDRPADFADVHLFLAAGDLGPGVGNIVLAGFDPLQPHGQGGIDPEPQEGHVHLVGQRLDPRAFVRPRGHGVEDHRLSGRERRPRFVVAGGIGLGGSFRRITFRRQTVEQTDPRRAQTISALSYRAQAAEELGRGEVSRNFYERVLTAVPRNAEEKRKQEEIRQFLSQENLKKKIQKKQWMAVTTQIYADVKAGKRKLDQVNFDILLYAEKNKKGRKKWEGTLAAYALLAKYSKKRAAIVEALIDQGEAAEKLGGRRRAKGYYEKALKKIPSKNIEQLLYIVAQLERLYLHEKNHPSLVRVYEKAYQALKRFPKRKKESRDYAFRIGYQRLVHLKEPRKARTWLMRADRGGTGESELQAVYWISQMDRQAGNDNAALKRLQAATKRKIPTSSSWYLLIHYELGTLYHLREEWESAMKHYLQAGKSKPSKEFIEYHQSAVERAAEIKSYLESLPPKQ